MKCLLNYAGRRFYAVICGIETIGDIQVENGKVFLCQNNVEGRYCKDRLGYRYSWCLGNGYNGGIWSNVVEFSIIK